MKRDKLIWIQLGVGIVVLLVIVLFLKYCKAHVEGIIVEVRPDKYLILIIYDSNEDYFKGRESFLRSRRDAFDLSAEKIERDTRCKNIQCTGYLGHKEMTKNSDYVDVSIQKNIMYLEIFLTDTNNKPLMINGKYKLKRTIDPYGVTYTTE